jgi:hypothetical protein
MFVGAATWKAGLVPELREIRADVEDALERFRVPAYVVDREGIVRLRPERVERALLRS